MTRSPFWKYLVCPPDLFDDAGEFVAGDDGKVREILPLEDVDIGPAYADGLDLDQQLIILDLGDRGRPGPGLFLFR